MVQVFFRAEGGQISNKDRFRSHLLCKMNALNHIKCCNAAQRMRQKAMTEEVDLPHHHFNLAPKTRYYKVYTIYLNLYTHKSEFDVGKSEFENWTG